MSDLKSHFYDAANFEFNLGSGHYKPAAAFEIAHNISGIAHYYKFPTVTVEGEASNLSIFFDSYTGNKYFKDVMACYRHPLECDYRREKIAELDPALMGELQGEWQALKDLNPELEVVQIDVNDPLHLMDALRGAASLFNPDDISFFLDLCVKEKSWAAAVNAHEVPGYTDLANRVIALAGDRPGWVVSPGTLEKIEKQFTAPIQPSLNP